MPTGVTVFCGEALPIGIIAIAILGARIPDPSVGLSFGLWFRQGFSLGFRDLLGLWLGCVFRERWFGGVFLRVALGDGFFGRFFVGFGGCVG